MDLTRGYLPVFNYRIYLCLMGVGNYKEEGGYMKNVKRFLLVLVIILLMSTSAIKAAGAVSLYCNVPALSQWMTCSSRTKTTITAQEVYAIDVYKDRTLGLDLLRDGFGTDNFNRAINEGETVVFNNALATLAGYEYTLKVKSRSIKLNKTPSFLNWWYN